MRDVQEMGSENQHKFKDQEIRKILHTLIQTGHVFGFLSKALFRQYSQNAFSPSLTFNITRHCTSTYMPTSCLNSVLEDLLAHWTS